MKLLALDTATEVCSAAVWIDGQLRTREAVAPREHGRLLLPMVEELLTESGLGLAALDAIAFGRGPGAFTGLRLAAAVAQGLGFACGRPLIAVSDLRALAAQALWTPQAQGTPASAAPAVRVLVCQDARMEEVYWACFEAAGQPPVPQLLGVEHVSAPLAVEVPPGVLREAPLGASGEVPGEVPGAPPHRASPERPARAPQPGRLALYAVGSGFEAYPVLRERWWAAAVTLWLPALRPRAQEIARLAAADGLACAVAPEQALPVYLRDQVTRSP